MNLTSLLALSSALTLSLSAASATDWPQWRGPNQNGSIRMEGLPTQVGPETLRWSTPLPGKAGSTPVVTGNRVFLTSPDEQRNLVLFCLDRTTGKVLWNRTVGVGDKDVGRNNTCAPSPVTDGKRVYALFGTGDFAAFDLDGKQLWARNLGKDFGSLGLMWIYGASPLLHEGRLYLSILQRKEVPPDYPRFDGRPERDSFVLCVDPKTGKDLWKAIRTTDSGTERHRLDHRRWRPGQRPSPQGRLGDLARPPV